MEEAKADRGLLEAAVAGDIASVRQRLEAGADPDGADDRGWTALTWAAGKGAGAVVDCLLSAGAHPLVFTDDGRTPYLVAAAAGHAEVARGLAAAEESAGGDPERKSSRLHETQPYCRAYALGQLRAFAGWSESRPAPPEHLPSHMGEELFEPLSDDDIVYLHRSLCVTRSIFEDELVLFDGQAPGWEAFCRDVLSFRPMDDFDWIAADGPQQDGAESRG